jgi:nitroreductase/NAD-dependent dihydropyrimidine dehydrogenase PreA subunit
MAVMIAAGCRSHYRMTTEDNPMDRTVTTVIDPDRCTGCGLCIRVCPSETLSMVNEKAAVTGSESIGCGHCQAVCPARAIRIAALPEDALALSTLTVKDRWLAHGDFDTAELVRLMRSRRSCRNYTDRPIEKEILQDLVKIGTTAPSGSNCQKWTFTILPHRPAVRALGDAVAGFFKTLNKKAASPLLRGLLKCIGRRELDTYYRDYFHTIEEKLADWEKGGRDWLFWEAPAVIVVGSAPGAACPVEDAMLATGNMLLAAHSMGLGTCVIGFAVAAMTNDPAIAREMGIPDDETVHAVIALGWPDEAYQRLTGRKPATTRYVEG